MNDSLQTELSAADPVSVREDARLQDLVRRTALAARSEAIADSPSPTPWWKRRRAMIPLGIAGVVALTGASLLVPLNKFWIDGMQADADAIIPIVYTTDTGVEVSCRYSIYFGDPADRTEDDQQLAAFVAEHDWTAIGQRVYERAIADPFIPGVNGGFGDDTDDTPQRRDEASLFSAIGAVIEEEIPDRLRDTSRLGLVDSGMSDCKGQLH